MSKQKAERQKGFEKMGKKNQKAYIPEALDYLENVILKNRQPAKGPQFSTVRLNKEGLENSIRTLPKKDRESLEKFYGLTGGENYRKRMESSNLSGPLIEMRDKAQEALRKLSKLELAKEYEPNFDWLVEKVTSKINNNNGVSDFTSVKIVMAFLIIAGNGPKLSCETNPMLIDIRIDTLYPNEVQSLIEMAEELERFGDGVINIRMITEMFKMLNFKDCLTIFENYGIPQTEMFTEKETFRSDELEVFKKMRDIRAFKEKIFSSGTWDITCQLTMGWPIDVEKFMEEMDQLHKDWRWVDKFEQFKVGSKKIRILSEVKTLDVYCVGGLEFTDVREIDFLYLYFKHA